MIQPQIRMKINEDYRFGNLNFTQLGRLYKIDRKTAKKIVVGQNQINDDGEPVTFKRKKRQYSSKLDVHKDFIVDILIEDRKTYRKQRHSNQRIYDRLCQERQYTGCYRHCSRYIKNLRESLILDYPENSGVRAFSELVWHPGQAQFDTGQIHLELDGIEVVSNCAVLSFPFSNIAYCYMLKDLTLVELSNSLRVFFEEIGMVPRDIVFDNATPIGCKRNGVEEFNEEFLRFADHYGFTPKLTQPYSGHEKGNVERNVYWVRSHIFTPVPKFTIDEWDEKNQEFLKTCKCKKANLVHYKKNELIGKLHKTDTDNMTYLPKNPYIVSEVQIKKTTKYATVTYKKQQFQLPHHLVRVKVKIVRTHEFITIYDMNDNEIIRVPSTTKVREYEKSDFTMMEFLYQIMKKPGSWVNSKFRKLCDEKIKKFFDGLSKDNLMMSARQLYVIGTEHGYTAAVKIFKQDYIEHLLDENKRQEIIDEEYKKFCEEVDEDKEPEDETDDSQEINSFLRGLE